MALAQVNTQNKWLSSATNTSFNHGNDIERYKTFTTAMSNGEAPLIDEGLFDVMMRKLNSFFNGFSMENIKNLKDMMMNALSDILDIGYGILDRLGITSIVSSICGGFDANKYGQYGGMNGMYSLGLMSLLTALLCMAVKGALAIVAGALGVVGMAVNGIVKVVDLTLDTLGFNKAPSVVSGIGNSIFGTTNRQYVDTKIDVSGMVDDIIYDEKLLGAFKNTGTAQRLMSGYIGKGDEYESKLNTLLPNYKIADLGVTRNAGDNLLTGNRSRAVDGIDSVISSVSKKDYLMLL